MIELEVFCYLVRRWNSFQWKSCRGSFEVYCRSWVNFSDKACSRCNWMRNSFQYGPSCQFGLEWIHRFFTCMATSSSKIVFSFDSRSRRSAYMEWKNVRSITGKFVKKSSEICAWNKWDYQWKAFSPEVCRRRIGKAGMKNISAFLLGPCSWSKMFQ